jgi:hypothetical protein
VVYVLGRFLGIKDDEATRAKATWAIEQGVAFAAEKFRNIPVDGKTKKEVAIQTAQSIAPAAMKTLDPAQKSFLTDATYARLRPSLPGHTTFVTHGDALEHQSETVVLPPPPRMPERPTPLPRHKGGA